MKLEASRVTVADSSEPWMLQAVDTLRQSAPDAGAVIAIYNIHTGPIGFDLDDRGESVFRAVIGEGYSAQAERGEPSHYVGGGATDYVRALFVKGSTLPILVAKAPLIAAGSTVHGSLPDATISLIARLSKLDIDGGSKELSEGLAKLAMECDRVCICTVGQWETRILTTHRTQVLNALQRICASVDVGFEVVSDDASLPCW